MDSSCARQKRGLDEGKKHHRHPRCLQWEHPTHGVLGRQEVGHRWEHGVLGRQELGHGRQGRAPQEDAGTGRRRAWGRRRIRLQATRPAAESAACGSRLARAGGSARQAPRHVSGLRRRSVRRITSAGSVLGRSTEALPGGEADGNTRRGARALAWHRPRRNPPRCSATGARGGHARAGRPGRKAP